MDVRCERCQTEYELDDASVSDAGTQVQCTTCGHAFMMRRTLVSAATADARVQSAPPPDHAGPGAADWLLETSEGQFHRFRNLTSLQKWIIERKVAREDRISRTGHAWRQLGEIVELAPFFDVIDEADKAKALRMASLQAEAAQARKIGRVTPVRMSSMTSVPSTLRGYPPAEEAGSLSTSLRRGTPSASPAMVDSEVPEIPTSVIRDARGNGLKLFVLITVPAVLIVAVFVLWPMGGGSGGNGHAPVANVQQPVAPIPAVPPLAVPVAAVQGQSPAAVPSGAQVVPLPAPVAEPAPAVPDQAAPKSARAVAEPEPADGDQSKSYERLVGEADRAIENGGTARAEKLYEKALKANPTGAGALSGMGYAALDRGRTAQAVSYFRRALASQPYPPAVFGLAEASRALGNDEEALEHYKKYLDMAPGGQDATAAQRQLKALQTKASGHDRTVAPPPSTAPASPPSAPVSPPATAPPPPPPTDPLSPSSVLSEPAK